MKIAAEVDEAQVKKMLADLADIGKRRHVLAALYQGARVYQAEIIKRAHVDTGFLQKSISAWRVPKRHQVDPNVHEARAGVVRNVFRLNRPRRVALTGRRYKHKTMRGSAPVINAFYARYLEGGTSKMTAKPFVGPARQAAHAAAMSAIEANVTKSVQRLKK